MNQNLRRFLLIATVFLCLLLIFYGGALAAYRTALIWG